MLCYFCKKLPFLILILGSFILLGQNALAQCGPGQIDINQASLIELQELTGIGAVYAQRIIEARPFSSIDELTKVKGIGEKTLAKIESQGKACLSTASVGGQQGLPGNTLPNASSSLSKAPVTQPQSNTNGRLTGKTIKLNHPPRANAGENIITNVGSIIHFDGSKSQDEDGDQLTFSWNLGNGETRNGAEFNYSYQHTGQYVVVLEVSDGHLLDTDTLVVSVYPAKVSISEFLPNPKGKGEESEWIEIANSSDSLVDVSGWQLQVGGSQTKQFIFPSNSLLLPHSFLVFDRKTTKLSLSNKQGDIRLLYPSGEIADEIGYQDAQANMSAAKKGEKFFWTDLPTPGMKNVIFLKQDRAKPKKTAKTISSAELPLTERQSFLFSSRKEIVSQRSLSRNNLAYQRYSVFFPSLSDLDKIFVAQSAFAQSNKGRELSRKQTPIKRIESSQKKAKLVLVFTIFTSSFLFSLWGIVLRNRFFA